MSRSQDDSEGNLHSGLDGYQSGKPAVLDHLVSIDERKEDAPALLLQGEQSLRSPFHRHSVVRYTLSVGLMVMVEAENICQPPKANILMQRSG